MYSRAPTAEEATIIDKSMVRMNRTYGAQMEGDLPFSQVAIQNNRKFEDLEERIEEKCVQGLSDLDSDEDHSGKGTAELTVIPAKLRMTDQSGEDITDKPKKMSKPVRKKQKRDRVDVEEQGKERVTDILQDKQPGVVRVRPKPAKRKVSNLQSDDPPSPKIKRRRVNSTGPPVVAVVSEMADYESTSGPAKGTSANKFAGKDLGKGWKGYALVDVEQLNGGSRSNLEAKVSSQESNGQFKIHKSKRHK
ncbi:hypothetical protein DFH28DRAFT_1191739 [Melampsora americana]|nr:hypothetical protein DFH28DRAFT_1191739 [Melampsora americana]